MVTSSVECSRKETQMSRFHMSKFRPKVKDNEFQLWRSEMQKQFCRDPLREKERVVKETRAEFVPSEVAPISWSATSVLVLMWFKNVQR